MSPGHHHHQGDRQRWAPGEPQPSRMGRKKNDKQNISITEGPRQTSRKVHLEKECASGKCPAEPGGVKMQHVWMREMSASRLGGGFQGTHVCQDSPTAPKTHTLYWLVINTRAEAIGFVGQELFVCFRKALYKTPQQDRKEGPGCSQGTYVGSPPGPLSSSPPDSPGPSQLLICPL